jgi:putative peptidoglycan lipid II flippase
MAAYQLNILVSTVLASGAGTGAIASVQYSQRLQELVLGIFVVSAGTVLLPGLSKSAREGDWAAFSSSLGDCLKAILLITLPVAVFASLEGEDIVVLLFKRREFGAESARLTVEVFLCHMTGLVFIAANRILSSAFYARGDTKTPTWAGLVSIGVNLLASLVFSRSLGAPGIALALSLASAVNTALLVAALLTLPLPGLREGLSGAARYGLRLLAFSILAGLALLGIRLFLPSAEFVKFARGETLGAGLSLLFSGIVYASVGIGALALSRDRFAASILRAFKK